MNPVRWIAERRHRSRAGKPAVRMKISNLTRNSVLASCAEVADREATRRKGLLGRDGLAPGEGLWIVPCEAIHTFGMRFSIDLVYLDRTLRVRKVRNAVHPWRMSACLAAHSIIELPAGTVLATRTSCGDILQFSSANQPE